VGYALGNKDLIEALIRVKDSFNSYPIDRFAEAGAIAAMQDKAYFEATRQKVMASRGALIKGLQALDFEILPSGANFIFAKHRTHDGAKLAEKLREKSMIIRHFKKPTRIVPYLRITVGTDAQIKLLIAALSAIVNN
jgi:histidinol-phosphate aminotransferase